MPARSRARRSCPTSSITTDGCSTARTARWTLRTSELLPHRREDFITKLSPVKYDPSLVCLAFKAFLKSTFQNNERLIAFVRRMIGYTLTGDTSERAVFVLYGCGADGKSTLLAVLRELLGPYASQIGADALMVKKNEGIRNDLAKLKGARAVSAVESDEGRHSARDWSKACPAARTRSPRDSSIPRNSITCRNTSST